MTPLESAEDRCKEIDAVPEGDRFAEEKHMLALWDEVQRLRLINPVPLRLHVEHVARLRAAAEELERRITIERGETPSP